MIGSLRGILLDRQVRRDHPSADVLVEAGGVGYRAIVPARALPGLGELGSPVFLHVYTHVRDDAIILYGFPGRDERGCFETLIGTHGVGPAVALALLSVHSPAGLRRAVATDDVDALTLVPGIGKKTAARLLIELKTRLELEDWEPDLAVVGTNGATGNGHAPSSAAAAMSEVRAALAGLGYGVDEVRDALRVLPEHDDAESLLRAALRQLAGAR
jgi:holliday junction DNA helicase RuvA